MTTLLLALRLLSRDWKARELYVLVVAILVAVSCVTAVTFFTDRIDQALKYQAGELLAADLRLVADHRIPAQYPRQVNKLKLHSAEIRNFRSMILAGDNSRLAEIKAVSEHYPLRGRLKISPQRFLAGEPTDSIPVRGTVWVEASLLSQLGISVNDTIQLGEGQFQIAAIITYEPDRSGEIFNIAPRVMINIADLDSTQLDQEGSRIRYSLLIAGTGDQIKRYRLWAEQRLQSGERIEGVSDARKEVRVALSRAKQFLNLSALVSVVLSFIAIAMSAGRFAERHLDACAIMRCVGAQQRQIVQLYFVQLLILGLVMSLAGSLIGYLAQGGLAYLLAKMLLLNLPSPSGFPVVTGITVGLLGLLGFALPPVLRLRSVPTLRVLRRDLGPLPSSTLSTYGLGLLAVAILILWQAGDWSLGFTVLGGLAVAGSVLIVLTIGLISVLRTLKGSNASAMSFGLANITRHTRRSVTQVLAFGVGITVLLLLTIVRGDILNTWRDRLPEDAANRFVINIQPSQIESVQAFFYQENLSDIQLFPMVRGRLHAINEKPVVPPEQGDERSHRLARREFNLSWLETMQTDNKIVAGQWWGTESKPHPQFSVEQGIADRLGIKLGDRLTYIIAGETLVAPVTSLRSVQWDTFRPNFFILTPPGVLEKYPASYITSFYLPKQQFSLLDDLVKTFPNLTVIDISAVMNHIRTIMDRVHLAVEYVFLFTLIAGLTVLYAAIQSTHDQRLHDNAVLRALGASRWRLLLGLATEFLTLGVLAGTIAAIAAYGLGYWLATEVFQLAYSFNLSIMIAGALGGGLGIGVAGLLGTRSVLAHPPLHVLREV